MPIERGQRLLDYSTEELVLRWEDFFDEGNYAGRITAIADAFPDEKSLYVDYTEIERFDTDLAIYLMEHPQNAIYAAEQAIRQFIPPTEEAEIHFRIRGIPRDLRVEVRDLRAEHLGRLISVEGLVRKATEVRPRLVEAVFQCLRCGAIIKELQEGMTFREPLECYQDQGGCGRTPGSTKFKLLDEGSRFVDTQKIEIQEPPEGLRGGEQPQRLVAYVEDDLTGQMYPGDRVVLNGILRSAQRGRFSARSTLFDIFLDVVSVEMEQVEYEEIEITEEDEKRIREEAASGDIIRKIVGSIAPSIYGLEVEKEALALQLFGGVPKELPDGRRIRGDIHILLVGDPGVAKSELLTYMTKLSPRGIYASGKASSAAGLTAAAVRDEFGEGRWTLEAGVLVLADKGLAALDEIEKMSEQDRSSIHTAMEQQAVHVAKAGITATLQTRCAVLAAANPTFGRFDERKFIAEQINLPPTLLSVDGREPLLVRRKGIVQSTTIGQLVDGYYSQGEEGHPIYLPDEELEVPAFDPKTFKICWAPVRYVFRHTIMEPLYRVDLETGRSVRLTGGHSVYVFEDGKVKTKPTAELRPGDHVVIPGRLPPLERANLDEIDLVEELLKLPRRLIRTIYLHEVPESVYERILEFLPKNRRYWARRRILPLTYAALLSPYERRECTLMNMGGRKAVPARVPVNSSLMRFLGYYIAEGSLTFSSSRSFMISLSFNRKEREYVDDMRKICEELFGIRPRLSPEKGSTKVVISNKILYLLLERILNLPRAAHKKCVPTLVFNVPPHLQKEFLIGYLRGDREVTVSSRLMSDILYLLLQTGTVGSVHRTKEVTAVFPGGHTATSSGDLLVSPNPYREMRLRNRGRMRLIPYREVTGVLAGILGRSYEGGHGKPCNNARLGPSLRSQLLGRMKTQERLRRLILLREPRTTTEAAYLFRRTGNREHARAYLRRLYQQGLAKREVVLGRGQGFSWRYRYRLSSKGEGILPAIDRLKALAKGDLAFARVRSIRKSKATGKFVYDLSTPGRENFIAGFGGVVCHNSRFDCIFPLMDRPQAQHDRSMAEHILKGHWVGERLQKARAKGSPSGEGVRDDAFLPYLDPSLLRKYVAYAKRIYPVMTPEAMRILQEKYLEIRRQGETEGGAVPITPRQLEAFIRLAEASARARLSDVVTEEDAQRSVRIIEYWLQKVTGIEGTFDIDIVATGVSQSQRNQMMALREIIEELCERDGTADIRDILEMAEERDIPPSRVEAWLKRWSQEGEVYSPARNKWKLVGRF